MQIGVIILMSHMLWLLCRTELTDISVIAISTQEFKQMLKLAVVYRGMLPRPKGNSEKIMAWLIFGSKCLNQDFYKRKKKT